jgi:hypothetical protein
MFILPKAKSGVRAPVGASICAAYQEDPKDNEWVIGAYIFKNKPF